MKQKDVGFVEKLLPILFGIGMAFGLLILSARFTQVIRVRENINQVARAYLLEMETFGYLPQEKTLQLKDTLQKYGLQDVNLNGTTIQKADYGELIELCILGNLKWDIDVKIPFIVNKDIMWNIPIDICMVSTAKH